MYRNFPYSVLVIWFLLPVLQAADWEVPLAGNAFQTSPATSGDRPRRDGLLTWRDAGTVYSVFVHADRAAELDLSLVGGVPGGESTISVSSDDQSFTKTLSGKEMSAHEMGRVTIKQAGYVRFDLRGVKRDGELFAELQSLRISSETPELQLDFVRNNDSNMFYWGRRGPSVHLSYQTPPDRRIRFAYSEITVPEGHDPIGSYFMANGFGEGYFGMQVNSPTERRVLFSVWSPFQTDNPKDIPEDQRIKLLTKGADVRTGEFGNEGSGGQSYLIFPWIAGKTYRFLTEVKPDDSGNTVYTSWFGDKAEGTWRLIASFQRPKTSTDLTRFHSFLENFNPVTGHIVRSANWENVWVRDVAGDWHECLSARFSVDNTGRNRHRLDYTGGSDGRSFFLRNCGFFSETGSPGDVFTRESSGLGEPRIDFDQLPRE